MTQAISNGRTFDLTKEFVPVSDILTLHLPLSARTRKIIDAAALRRIPKGSILINTARGGLVDEVALCAAISGRHLFGAGLDAFVEEPLPKTHILCQLPTVVLTPHNAVGTLDTFQLRMDAIFRNVIHFQNNEPLDCPASAPVRQI